MCFMNYTNTSRKTVFLEWLKPFPTETNLLKIISGGRAPRKLAPMKMTNIKLSVGIQIKEIVVISYCFVVGTKGLLGALFNVVF